MEFFPATMLVGPRQSGKTTLAKKFEEESGMSYASFDEMVNLISVQLDPIQFLELLKKPLVLDEIQRAPEIFLPIKVDIDQNRKAGRYLLTGSANPLLVPKIGDALTGRMAISTMWPLSQGEILGKKEKFLDCLFSDVAWSSHYEGCQQEELIQKFFRGGFPTLQKGNERQRKEWCNQYLFLMLQKDINDLSKIEGFSHLPALVYGLAARVGSTLNIEELSRITKTASTSVRRYMQLLESLFLLYRLGSWSLNVDKQLTKSPKLYFSDTALMLFILNMDEDLLRKDPQTLGYVLENFVVMECVKQCSWSSLSPKLFHYREEKGKNVEVDLVMEAKQKVVGVEIKLSSIVRPDDLKGLKSLKETAGKRFHKGIVLYTGSKILPLGDGLLAVPLSALWS